MLEGAQISVISPASGLAIFFLGLFIYLVNRRSAAARLFLLISALFAFTGFVDYFASTAPDAQTAIVLERLLFFCIVIIFAGVLYMASLLPYERYSGWFSRNKLEFAIIALLSAYIPADAITTVDLDYYGWNVPLQWAGYTLAVFVIGYIAVTVYMLTKVCLSTTDKTIRRQCTLIAVAVVSPVLYGAGVVIVNASPIQVTIPRLLSPGFLIFGIILAYAMLFGPRLPQLLGGEGSAGKQSKPSALLVEGKTPDQAFEVLRESVDLGVPALIVVRTHPDTIRSTYDVGDSAILWLATQAGPDRIDPTNIGILQHTVTEFLHRNPTGTVMIEGLEYLLTENAPEKVLKMAEGLRDEVIVSGGKLIIAIDPETLDERRRSMFEREFEVVRPGRGAGTEI
ncbi:MAG: DUF835 domain-containing protein [Methanomassiliicoccales archaeon]|nr:DUF835 domain-containing protein [Methanomassiliicoccales archaeon]